MIEQLQELTQCGRPWAAQRAEMALQICAAVQNGDISESEFKELMADLVRMDKLDEEADDLETKTMLVTAVYAVAQIV
jgi:polyhydroxyalkanoate synthesis regulator phasin